MQKARLTHLPELESQTRQKVSSQISTHPQGRFDPLGHLQGGFDPLGHLHGGFDPSAHSQPARLTHLPELESQNRQFLSSQSSTHPQGGFDWSGHLSQG